MSEIWKAVPGYEGHYEVSNQGRVRSLKRRVVRVMSQRRIGGSDGSTYFAVCLYLGNAPTTRTVHSLVLDAFIGPRPDGQIGLHGPGGPRDNRPENLRYGTHAQNSADMVRDGKSLQGVKHHKAKLSDAQVLSIRADRRGARRLGKAYGVSRSAIQFIKSGQTWRHLLPGGV